MFVFRIVVFLVVLPIYLTMRRMNLHSISGNFQICNKKQILRNKRQKTGNKIISGVSG
jgi:hypothetical protein